MNKVRFLRGKQEDLDKLIEKMKSEATASQESDLENEIKNSNENEK